LSETGSEMFIVLMREEIGRMAKFGKVGKRTTITAIA